ncbi:MAG: transporter substrate-binding protein, partial [Pseudomonadota bacterium]|nr:transporter substrate-binding protein [Pseudomonadota bacterium]
MTTTSLRKLIAGSSIALGLTGFGSAAIAQEQTQDDGPIRVGILHSLSGTMAISESTLKDEMLMLIDKQN